MFLVTDCDELMCAEDESQSGSDALNTGILIVFGFVCCALMITLVIVQHRYRICFLNAVVSSSSSLSFLAKRDYVTFG